MKKVELSKISKTVIRDNLPSLVNLLQGSVSGSKSYTADFVATEYIKNHVPPGGKILISGESIDTVKGNVLSEWSKKLKANFVKHENADGNYYTINHTGLHTHKFYVRGAGKKNDDKYIKGATFDFWYADELDNHTKEFFDMARTRLRKKWSKNVSTCNPDSPYHYIHCDFIEREKALVEKIRLGYPITLDDKDFLKGFKSYFFSLFDNPSLPQSYISILKASFKGVFYRRKILGEWIEAEGAIYSDIKVCDRIPLNPDYIFIGVDYGSENATFFVKIYVKNGVYYAVDEYSHSGRESGQKLAPSQYAQEFKIFLGSDALRPHAIFVDPSATHFIRELRLAGIKNVVDADNNIIEGIRHTQTMFYKDTFRIHKENCPILYRQTGAYVWDDKAEKAGKTHPLEINDHGPDSVRYVLWTTSPIQRASAKSGGSKRHTPKVLRKFGIS